MSSVDGGAAGAAPFATRVLPVLVIDDAAQAVPLGRALRAGGIDAVEVTLRTAAATEAIRALCSELPDLVVGAGTVLTPEQAREALDAGAAFAVAPGLDPEVVAIFQEADVPFLPGVMTPSEVGRALRMGCRWLKFFPAEAAGGVAALKAILAPFRGQVAGVCPTGGIRAETAPHYLALPEVFAVGGSWLAPKGLVASGNWAAIEGLARAAVAAS